MVEVISKTTLNVDGEDIAAHQDDQIDILDPEDLVDLGDDRPHLVFLISGIRTNGWWTQQARHQELLWDGRDVSFIPVRGNGGSSGRISTMHLVSRFGLRRFRSHFASQILDTVARKPSFSINIVAHSMGSSLFAEIVEHVAKSLARDGMRIGTIVFLGSICHRGYSRTISGLCERFVNDVGTDDWMPYLASVVRPWSYSDVGRSGFLDAYALDRFYAHDHSSCTSFEHLKSEVVPLISSTEVTPLGTPKSVPRYYNRLTYLRRTIWGAALILIGWALFACARLVS